MAYGFNCSEKDSNVIQICVDAASYSANAKTIDVSMNYYGGSIATHTYTVTAEVWNGSAWVAKKLLTGSFSHNVNRSFTISTLGLKSGSNSVRIKGYFTRTSSSTTTDYKTSAFIVKR
ncbi:hypothetical protein [Peribacillus simplex]|uniref:hypothetical protein n=1 Tax=Peribacillus simplex TaxID=1478 RepID=UPI003D2A2F8C